MGTQTLLVVMLEPDVCLVMGDLGVDANFNRVVSRVTANTKQSKVAATSDSISVLLRSDSHCTSLAGSSFRWIAIHIKSVQQRLAACRAPDSLWQVKQNGGCAFGGRECQVHNTRILE